MKTKSRKRGRSLNYKRLLELQQTILKTVQTAFDPDDAEDWLNCYLEPLVKERAEVEADDVNTCGPQAQLAYILKGWNRRLLEQALKDLKRELKTNPAQRPDPARPVRRHR